MWYGDGRRSRHQAIATGRVALAKWSTSHDPIVYAEAITGCCKMYNSSQSDHFNTPRKSYLPGRRRLCVCSAGSRRVVVGLPSNAPPSMRPSRSPYIRLFSSSQAMNPLRQSCNQASDSSVRGIYFLDHHFALSKWRHVSTCGHPFSERRAGSAKYELLSSFRASRSARQCH
ncbi:hypothetical protein BV25DRAFT_261431 [Artomyces pyxidatus]|uniref:Uncharacterized protein n=1 Tax=Artomyces pyxidatus TaxID=48021 RepID=A0ACB8T7T5_9AGAM|nr:hypothetical protein BV25DRAFT_261431 [Artomyces pyxidatus]